MTIEILLCITANFGHFLTFLLKPPQLFIRLILDTSVQNKYGIFCNQL